MDNARNIHTFFCPDAPFAKPALVEVHPYGSIDTSTADKWGMFQGDPAVLVAGDMTPHPGADDPYQGNIRATNSRVFYEHPDGHGGFYYGKYIHVGFIYEGPSSEFSVRVGGADGGYDASAQYDLQSPPKVVWAVGGTVIPPPPSTFWANFKECREVEA